MTPSRIAAMSSFCVGSLILAGCGQGGGAGEPAKTVPSTTQASVAVSVSPAPTQPSNARKPVRYDPCFEIGDTTVVKAGFDPKTRERVDQVHDDYAFLSCSFDRKQDVRGRSLRVGSLTVSSTNITLDEFRQREGAAATNTKVNGRDAITYRRSAEEACYVVMNGPDGTVDVRVSSAAALSEWNACDHAQEIAAIIESTTPTK
ncbi:DUF3558 family protein [Nocardia sp. NPDC052566]|uniref:DUF3558 family protein n=1 Tax=Nocardia sp. NPDC052566 TaxID=3364330 RepID=UPI0037C9E924